jgi:hypothetical protein
MDDSNLRFKQGSDAERPAQQQLQERLTRGNYTVDAQPEETTR